MHQLHNREINEKHFEIMVNFLFWKDQFLINETIVPLYIFMLLWHFIYISPSWSNSNTVCTMIDCKRFSVSRADHEVQKFGHLWTTGRITGVHLLAGEKRFFSKSKLAAGFTQPPTQHPHSSLTPCCTRADSAALAAIQICCEQMSTCFSPVYSN